MSTPIRFSVLTISDRCANGTAGDKSGPALVQAVTKQLDATCVDTALVPDEPEQIITALRAWVDQPWPADLLFTTGGTGLSPRDITPEATAQVIERRHDALLELARMRCYRKTPLTYLSRGIAGAAKQSLIINLPGSPRGAVEMFEALADVLPHAIQTLHGQAKLPSQHQLPASAQAPDENRA